MRTCLKDVFCLCLQKTPSRRISSSYSYVFRKRLYQDQYIRLDYTSSRRLAKAFQDIFKRSSKRFQDIFKAPCLEDIFKMHYQLNCSVLLFKTFLRRTAKTVIYKRLCLGHTSEKFMISVQNLQG